MRKTKHFRKARYLHNTPERKQHLAIPFLLVLSVLTVISFIIPLRPTVSMSEKRELHKFPAFSLDTLVSGDYFDDITLWFSDTFPGRESWIRLSDYTSSLHGYSEISFVEDDFVSEIVNAAPDEMQHAPTEPVPSILETSPAAETATCPVTVPSSSVPITEPLPTEEQEPATEAPLPTETEWGGVDAGENAEISRSTIIQIGDTAFNSLGFTDYISQRYTAALSKLADELTEQGIRVVSAPAPTAVGIMVQPEYLEKLGCADQNMIIHYLHDTMSANVITVDNYAALVAHNDEYLFFRTDHHWTARGAYYAYAAIVEALGMEAAPLDSFEEWDQGEFKGTLYTKAPYKNKLKTDTLYAYVPQGEITTQVLYKFNTVNTDLIHDKTKSDVFSKYLAFLGSDHELMKIVNDSLPDGGTCLILKDSFGNSLAPFLTQNYHTVYVMDYRSYHRMTVQKFVEEYQVDDVIFVPYLIATQSADGAKHFERLSKIAAEQPAQ